MDTGERFEESNYRLFEGQLRPKMTNLNSIAVAGAEEGLPSPGSAGNETSIHDNGQNLTNGLGAGPAFWCSPDGVYTFAGMLVTDKRFQQIIIFLILLNSIMLGVATFDFVTEDPAVLKIFERIDRIFLIIFTVEIILQFLFHGLYLFFDGWLVFDVTVIFISWAFASLQIIRAFRIFRALRLVTRIKELRRLVKVLLGVIPRMFAIGILLFLIFYVFAVMFTSLFKHLYRDGYTDRDYFSRIDITSLTLFQLMTLDSWSLIAHEVMDVYPWAWLPFVSFVLISSFFVINLVIGVICDAVASAAATEYRNSIHQIDSIESVESIDRNHRTAVPPDQLTLLSNKVEQLTMAVQMLIQSNTQMQQEIRQLKTD